MSHIVTIESRVHDPAAVTAACARLNLPAPTTGTVQLFSGESTGLLVQLPGWRYPLAIDILTGSLRFDNFNGQWGDQQQLSKFIQMYSVEKCRIEGAKRGCVVTESALEDGSIKIQIQEA